MCRIKRLQFHRFSFTAVVLRLPPPQHPTVLYHTVACSGVHVYAYLYGHPVKMALHGLSLFQSLLIII